VSNLDATLTVPTTRDVGQRCSAFSFIDTDSNPINGQTTIRWIRNMVAAMQVWHPWRTLGTYFPHIVVSCDYQLPKGVRGWWRGNTIWLCKTLNQAERRSTLTHELLHVTRGLAPPNLREREERQHLDDKTWYSSMPSSASTDPLVLAASGP
jgi:hypothetical protein